MALPDDPPVPEAPPPPPPQSFPASTFDLDADVGAIWAAGATWRAFARSCRATYDTVDPPAKGLRGSWVGQAGGGYEHHRLALNGDVQSVGALADAMAGHLDTLAQDLTSGQGRLDAALDRARAVCPMVAGDFVTFFPTDEDDLGALRALVAEARAIRDEVDATVAGRTGGITATSAELARVAASWTVTAFGSFPPFRVPVESNVNFRFIVVEGQVVVDTGAGNDDVDVSVDPDTGEIVVSVNGERRTFAAGTEVTIRSGSGDDDIEVDNAVARIVVLAGAGHDRVRTGGRHDVVIGGVGDDVVHAGAGNDYVSGGSGNDYVESFTGNDTVRGGEGADVIYGGGGADLVGGGDGRDYLEGGAGADRLDGGHGDDVVSGGRGDDRLAGGAGDDVVVAGLGGDRVHGGSGDDRTYAESGDTVAGSTNVAVTVDPEAGNDYIDIEGSEEFQERVNADLDMYRSTPAGTQMLASLDDVHEQTKSIAADWFILGGPAYGGDDVTIHQYDEQNGRASVRGVSWIAYDLDIDTNPEYRGSSNGRPATVLYHELAHAYDRSYGTRDGGVYDGSDGIDLGINNAERQAVGLPFDHDGNPETPEIVDPEHPLVYTENGLREQLGLERRDHYRGDD